MGTFDSVLPVEDISPVWLTLALTKAGKLQESRRVTAVRYESCGTGQLGDSYRFHLEYELPASGPATLVGKFASPDATSREFGRRSGYYRSEIGFYRELAPRLPVSVPLAIHAAVAENGTDFVLLMEDLAPARQVDQLVGCGADESARVLEQAAALHASSWHDKALADAEWLQGPLGIFNQVADNFADVVRGFPELGAELVSQEDLELAARLGQRSDAWKAVINEPQCLWHSDIRADNVLFEARGGSVPVVILDWQGLGFGRGTLDVALWMGTSMSSEDRRKHERDLIRHYHRALVGHGLSGYDAERCWNDYRLNAIHSLCVGIFGLGAVKRTARGDCMWKNWIARSAAQVRDLESFELLDKR